MTLIQTLLKKSIEDDNYRQIKDFHSLIKVKEDIETRERAIITNIKIGNRKKNKLREPLDIGGKVLVLAKRLKRRDAPGFLYKSTTQNKPFFNKGQIFFIRKRVPIDNSYYYWVSKEGE